MVDFTVLESGTPELSRAWAELAAKEVNKNDPICLHMGQCWQYMGSNAESHSFRHRNHPSTSKRLLIDIPREDT